MFQIKIKIKIRKIRKIRKIILTRENESLIFSTQLNTNSERGIIRLIPRELNYFVNTMGVVFHSTIPIHFAVVLIVNTTAQLMR